MGETAFLTELFKYGGLVGVLAYGLWIFWKRYDKFTERTATELAIVRQEIKDYMNSDRLKMQEALDRNSKALEQHNSIMTKVMGSWTCMVNEIKEFKKDEIYKDYIHRREQKSA